MVFFPLLKILAREAAREGFSATINADFIVIQNVFIGLCEKFSYQNHGREGDIFIIFAFFIRIRRFDLTAKQGSYILHAPPLFGSQFYFILRQI